ncbi:hypothetical protein RB593_006052 [Gaeumannomyces tritici]
MAAGLLTKGPPVEAKWVFFVRIAVIALSVLVLALTAWSMHVHVTPLDKIVGTSSSTTSSSCKSYYCRRSLEPRQYSYYYTASATSAPGMMLFSSIWTLLTFAVTLGVERSAPQSFFRICVFIAYILSAIFMLSGWAYMASAAAAYAPLADLYRQSRITSLDNYLTQLVASTAASAGLGAVLWVLVIIATVMFAINSLHTEGAPVSTGGTEMHAVAAQPQKGGEVAVETHQAPAPVYQTHAVPAQQQQQMYAPQQPGYVQQQQAYPQPTQQTQQPYVQQ